MQIRILIGPAGTGKTQTCLAGIRQDLRESAEGLSLVFLAPKQATFQLERQLLSGGEIRGYTRLEILSFERLAGFVLDRLGRARPEILSEQGRVMVLRALLAERHEVLLAYQRSAKRQGFAEELSGQIREFQNHGLGPEHVRKLAGEMAGKQRVREKLLDLALLYEGYVDWLKLHELEDGDALLTRAAEALESASPERFRIGGLWFDGFAQLTPQERALLLGLLRFSPKATLAFCMETPSAPDSPLSPWRLVGTTASRVVREIEAKFGKEAVRHEILRRDGDTNRLSGSAVLAHLEKSWGGAHLDLEPPDADSYGGLELIECQDPEGEATFCAREILRHVRNGGRYRDLAVLLRSFENDYPDVLRRVFTRYGIPCFLDHREGVAHHPLAELTRGALRTLAFNWRMTDWFGVLKSGLVPIADQYLDRLENAALARGWEGAVWRDGFKIPKDREQQDSLNALREQVVPPFLRLAKKLGANPTGRQLADGLRELWEKLRVRRQLEKWSSDAPSVHETVWQQMDGWLKNLALAFPERSISLREWLPILEAGLASLTVGVIPPVLDQVLIGAVDRSRNPDLKMLFVLGMNEGIFPAMPSQDRLLTESDRTWLVHAGCDLGGLPADHLAEEQFYGYIACTRARERLVLTYATSSVRGKALNPSRFLAHVRRIFPTLRPRRWTAPEDPAEAEHVAELLPRLPNAKAVSTLFGAPLPERFSEIEKKLAALRTPSEDEMLDPSLAEQLYGKELLASVSALEKFAACPFQFFVARGLRADERQLFQLDVREKGAFQHSVLELFHDQLMRDGKKWRDLSVEEARARIRTAAEEITPEFKEGLMLSSEQNRFTAESYAQALEEFIAAIIPWFKTNQFDPEQVELAFGPRDDLPGWQIELNQGRALILQGRIDRVDLLREGDDRAWCVIVDYKSGSNRPDRTLLHHGVQQQLPAYLLAITRMAESKERFGVKELLGAGVFFAPLTGRYKAGRSRAEVLANRLDARRGAYAHHGIFDLGLLHRLDEGGRENPSGQFRHSLNKDGQPAKKTFDALPAEAFHAVLARTEELMREIGERIYRGEIDISPYKHKSKTACERCKFMAICRFDPWEKAFNVLRAPAQPG